MRWLDFHCVFVNEWTQHEHVGLSEKKHKEEPKIER